MSAPPKKLSPFACDRVAREQSAPAGASKETGEIKNGEQPRPMRSWLCLFERLCRRVLRNNLQRMVTGEIVIEHDGTSERFGSLETNELMGHVHVQSPNFFRRTVTGGALGSAESYLESEWESDDLTQLFCVLLRNDQALQKFRSSFFTLSGVVSRIEHFRNRNSRNGSRRNIHDHYDLGNAFFSLFLDPTMMYSSALFPSE